MAEHFFDLRATHNPHRWFLPLHAGLCVGQPGKEFMFGGVGLASAIGAMEKTCGRPVIWATAQYLSYARPSSVLDLDVRIAAHGKHTTQARVVAHVGDREILTVNAALGQRPGAVDRQWASAPAVRRPEDCAGNKRWGQAPGDLHSHIEVRVARGSVRRDYPPDAPPSDGRVILWIRASDGQPVDSVLLAIMADHVPSGVGPALGRRAAGSSLDNTIRILNIVPTQWVLCDVTIIGVAHGVAHGAMRLYAEDGRLMATASQSMIVRVRDEEAGGAAPAGDSS